MATIREQLEVEARGYETTRLRIDNAGTFSEADARALQGHARSMVRLIDAMRLLADSPEAAKFLSGLAGMHPGNGGVIPSSGAGRRNVVGAGSALTSLAFGAEEMKALQAGAQDRRITKAAITSTTAPMAGIPQYDVSVFPYLRDRQRLLDLIPTKPTEAPSIHYFSGTTAASAAAAVAQGAAKPESSPV